MPRRPLAVLLTCAAVASVSVAGVSGRAASRDPAALVVAAVRSQLGDAYAWGAAGPRAYDCSGLTSWAWRGIGGAKGLPRTSAQQQRWAVPLPREQALPMRPLRPRGEEGLYDLWRQRRA